MTQPVKILLDRDSVCAGDDVSPHDRTIHVAPERCLLDVLVELKNSYLASIAGGQATWSVHLKPPTVFEDEHSKSWITEYEDTIAIVAQQWGEPEFLSHALTKDAKINTISKLFFAYHAQVDPWFAFRQLSRHQFFDNTSHRLQPVRASSKQ